MFLFDLEARQKLSSFALPPSARGYSDASGVAIDAHFHLFVADPHNDRVRHYSAFGRHLGDLGASPAAAGMRGRDRPGVLESPHAVAVDGDVVLVAGGDGALRNGVQRFTRRGEVLRPLRSFGDPERDFGAPRGLCADADGVLVADTLHGCIQRFRRDGSFVAAFAAATGAAVARPTAVLRLVGGDLLIVDAGDAKGLRRFAPDGAPRRSPGPIAEFADHPAALARDERGRVYLLDQGGERVQRFDAELRLDAPIVDLAEHVEDYERGTP